MIHDPDRSMPPRRACCGHAVDPRYSDRAKDSTGPMVASEDLRSDQCCGRPMHRPRLIDFVFETLDVVMITLACLACNSERAGPRRGAPLRQLAAP